MPNIIIIFLLIFHILIFSCFFVCSNLLCVCVSVYPVWQFCILIGAYNQFTLNMLLLMFDYKKQRFQFFLFVSPVLSFFHVCSGINRLIILITPFCLYWHLFYHIHSWHFKWLHYNLYCAFLIFKVKYRYFFNLKK